MMANISKEERKKAKDMGFLSNKDGEHFSARVVTENGVLNHKQMKNLSEATKKFGDGNVAFTTRLSVEVTGIKYKDINMFSEYIAKENMFTGGTGPRVRPVVACKGTVCKFGLIDTQKIAKRIHDRFYIPYYDVKLPHKFKISVGGCPNNCIKPSLNDLGIVGVRIPKDNRDIGKKSISGYKISIGGRWGRNTRVGSLLSKTFNEEEAMNIIEKSILLFKEKGNPKERFSSTIERLGLDFIETELFDDAILERKEQILNNK